MIIELHAIQSFAPANLNRDDTGAPKDCTFGGVRRGRVSSQSWKRAIRVAFRDEVAGIPTGTRTKRAHQKIVSRLESSDPGMDHERARHLAAVVLEAEPLGLNIRAEEGEEDEEETAVKTAQLVFFRDRDLDALAEIARDHADELLGLPSSLSGEKAQPKLGREAAKRVRATMTEPGDALDVALFGRMIAELPEGNVDAACQVAHAIGTHRLASEFDYYTAVDDLRPEDTEGADMIGTIQFNASCLYRYAALDVDQLARNLGPMSDEGALASSVAAFARAFVTAIPTGKQNTFAARNPPSSVLAIRRTAGAWNLANAFVAPVDARAAEDGVAAESTRRLMLELDTLLRMYGAPEHFAAALLTASPGEVGRTEHVAQVDNLDQLISQLIATG